MDKVSSKRKTWEIFKKILKISVDKVIIMRYYNKVVERDISNKK